MKEYLKSEHKPILIGIFAYSILYAANDLYGHFLIQTEIIKVDATNESWKDPEGNLVQLLQFKEGARA